MIRTQRNNLNFLTDLQPIYDSRTFVYMKISKKLKKIGLAKGGSLENAIVVDENKVLNDWWLKKSKGICKS